MLNQIILVGRLTRDIIVNKSENGTKVATISLAIPRSFKNSEGTYDTDFIDCVAFDNIAENTSEYCSKGDIVGNKSKRYTDKVQIIIALFINDFKGIFFFVISDMIK